MNRAEIFKIFNDIYTRYFSDLPSIDFDIQNLSNAYITTYKDVRGVFAENYTTSDKPIILVDIIYLTDLMFKISQTL